MANKVLSRANSSGSSVSLSEILEDLDREEEEEEVLNMGQGQTVMNDGGTSDTNLVTDDKSLEGIETNDNFGEDILLESKCSQEENSKYDSDIKGEVKNVVISTDLEENRCFEANSKNSDNINDFEEKQNPCSSNDVQSDEYVDLQSDSDSSKSCDYDLQDKKSTIIEEDLEKNPNIVNTENNNKSESLKPLHAIENSVNDNSAQIFKIIGVTTDETSDDLFESNSPVENNICDTLSPKILELKDVTINEASSVHFEETAMKVATNLVHVEGVTTDETSDDFTENAPKSFEVESVTIDETCGDFKENATKSFEVESVTIDETCGDFKENALKNKNEAIKEDDIDDEFVSSDDENFIIANTECFMPFSPIVEKKCFETESTIKSTSVSSETDVNNSYNLCSSINELLVLDSREAEARLLAKRAARAEAREIRMRDLERQQREQEENADRQFDMLAEPIIRRPGSTSRFLSSRRSSEDSLEDTGSLRDLRHELKEVEEKFRKAMIANAQLDNDKAAQTYQLDFLKDRLEELEQEHSQLKREHRDKCRDFEQLKRLTTKLKEDLGIVKAELEDRDRLIAEKGLVIVGEEESITEETSDGLVNGTTRIRRALVSAENAHLLEAAGEGSLDVRLGRFAKERGELEDQISHLKLELEEEKNKRRKHSGSTLNGPNYDSDYDAADMQREASKQLAEFKFRAQKAEQDVATLQATVARLESQVIRYKTAAEVSEKSEEALKAEKRKIQREAREAQSRAEELETTNTHLIKRLDKLKNAKSALLKEL